MLQLISLPQEQRCRPCKPQQQSSKKNFASGKAGLPETKLELGGSRDYPSPVILECWPQFLQALQTADPDCPIQSVCIGEALVHDLTELQLGDLLEHLGYLPQLRHLEITQWQSRHRRQRRVRTTHLATFLQRARQLQSLSVWPFLSISQSSLPLLNDALQQHPTLQSLHLLNLVTPGSDSTTFDANFSLCSLLEALATVPHLKQVQLAPGFSISPRTGLLSTTPVAQASQALVHLLTARRDTLESLALRNVGLSNGHVKDLVQGLSQAAAAVEAKHDNVSSLPFSCSKLMHLDFRFNPNITESGYQTLVKAISFVSPRQPNFLALQYLDLDWVNQGHGLQYEQEANVALALNRVGQQKYCQAHARVWQDQVPAWVACTQHGHDKNLSSRQQQLSMEPSALDLIYILLQHNPSVISKAVATAAMVDEI